MRKLALRAAAIFMCAAAAATGASAQECKPLETRKPNGEQQRPAFAGQTRACAAKADTGFEVTVLAKGLDHPWAVEPLPGRDFLVTEKGGAMRILSARGQLGEPLAGVPKVDPKGQGGLLDVALSPAFEADSTIFWSYSAPREGGNGTAVARGVLSKDRSAVEQVKVIFRAMPTYAGSLHFGSRLVFGPDKMLYVTLGDRSDASMRPQAQSLDSHMGKTLRIKPEGGAAEGNPFIGRQGALPEIWSLGHRNIQAAAFDEKGNFWIIEHGTRGGDEVNLVKKGVNYGWPLAAYGIEYSGGAIPGAATVKEGTEQPVYYWDPVIAPSGAQVYTGSAFPSWKGNLFVGGLRQTTLVRLVIEGDRVKGEEHLLKDRKKRVRDVKQGPDGALYVVTDERDGELLRIAPKR